MLPSWLGLNDDSRAAPGKLAQQGVAHALGHACVPAWSATIPVTKVGPRIAPVAIAVPKKVESIAPKTAKSPAHSVAASIAKTPNGAASTLVADAEKLLCTQFARLKAPGEKIATFRTPNGRHLALSRDLKSSIKVWVEGFPKEGMPGVSIDNTKNPGQPYSSTQPRSSNINFAGSRLAVGNQVYYLHVETLGALERLGSWYSGV